MNKKITERGFTIITFEDRYDHSCSLQKSSLATEDAIWFGLDNADPKILASDTDIRGSGWVTYPIPENVNLNTRMHLTRTQVAELLPYLQHFVKTGEL